MTVRRQIKRLAILLAVGYAALVILGGCADHLLFQPHPSSYQDAPDIIKIRTADGETLSAQQFLNPRARYTILYSHGNAEDLGDCFPLYEQLRHLGFNVLAYDYRGYGTSTGTPSEEGSYRDIEAAYEYLVNHLHVPPSRIVLLGRSVGGGPSTDLAVRKPVAGLVLESTFTSAFRIPLRFRFLWWDKFDNLEKVARLRCPLLVIHGRSDGVISCWHGEKLYEAAPQPKRCLWVEGAGHNDVHWVAGAAYGDAMVEFARCLQGQ